MSREESAKHQISSRRRFLTLAGAAGFACLTRGLAAERVAPVLGVQMYSLHDLFRNDAYGILRRVSAIGFETVEFENVCTTCPLEDARSMRRELDLIGLRCLSVHCSAADFQGGALRRGLESASILGCKLFVMSHPGQLVVDWRTVEGWQKIASVLNDAVESAQAYGMRIGYHNHDPEFLPLAEGQVPIEIIARETLPQVGLELDVANCVASHGDPVAFLHEHGQRVVSMHMKDFLPAPDRRYAVRLGDGVADWPNVVRAARSSIEPGFYFVEMEPQHALPPLEALAQDYNTAARLLMCP